MLGAFLAGSAVLGGVQSYNTNKVKSIQAKTNAKMAKMNAKNTSLKLNEDFNKAMASNMVISAAQNRRGGSVDAIASAMESEFEWDVAYATFEGEMGVSSQESAAESYKQAGYMGLGMGALNAGISGAMTYQSQGQIGAKTSVTE